MGYRIDKTRMAVRFHENDLLVDVCDDLFAPCFENEEKEEFTVQFVEENKKKVRIPDINRENLKAVSDLEYWKKFDDKCVACGGCNTVCGTCTCFDTVDVIYDEGSNEGERRRVWSGCMLEDFTKTAGGARSRKTQGANMRFKVFHKFYDYKDRFESFGDNYNVAIVGPPPMMHFSALGCMKLGVPAEKIWVSFERKMQCAVGKCGHCKINETYVCLEGPVFHYPKARTLFD